MRKAIKPVLQSMFRLLLCVCISGTMPRRQRGQHLLNVTSHESPIDGMPPGRLLPLAPEFLVNTGIAKRPLPVPGSGTTACQTLKAMAAA